MKGLEGAGRAVVGGGAMVGAKGPGAFAIAGRSLFGRRDAAGVEAAPARLPLARDPQRFEALFLRHYPRVYALLRRLLGSDEAAEDAAQEVFLRLYRQEDPPGDDEGLARWLSRVATNVGLNALRSDRRAVARLQRDAVLSRAEAVGRQERQDPAAAALAHEEAAAVRAVLDGMTERPRACLLLRSGGLSYAEIAEALGVAPGSVGTILARAERDFRRRYTEVRSEK